jgi:hypothetical protein
MSTAPSPVSDMLVTVKAREVQRALQAERRNDRHSATRHFLAAAHLELVLADDYAVAEQTELASRSKISAGSCLWRAGQIDEARRVFQGLISDDPSRKSEISALIKELESSA